MDNGDSQYNPSYEDRGQRGYFGLVLENPKYCENLAVAMRSAHCFGASFTGTIGERYKRGRADTSKVTHHIPCWNFNTFKDFYDRRPNNTTLIGVELDDRASDLDKFQWLGKGERSIFVMGAEDLGLSREARKSCNHIIQIPTHSRFSLNVGVAASIVMYEYSLFIRERRRKWMSDRTESNKVKHAE